MRKGELGRLCNVMDFMRSGSRETDIGIRWNSLGVGLTGSRMTGRITGCGLTG